MKETCTTCRFSQVHEGTTFCCFDPPEFIPPNSSALKPVRAEGWCGEYAEKVQKRRTTTKSVPAPRNDPNHVSFSKPSLPTVPKIFGFSEP